MMIKIMMFQDRKRSHMIELTLVVFKERVMLRVYRACFNSWLLERVMPFA